VCPREIETLRDEPPRSTVGRAQKNVLRESLGRA